MLLIFEGLDRVGKDTQIRLLQKYYYPKKMFHHFHYSGFSKNEYTPEEQLEFNKEFYEEMFELILTNKNKNIILNRSHLGEFVYGPLYRKYDPSYIWNLEQKFLLNYGRSVFLFTFIDEVDNLIKREDGKSFSLDVDSKKSEIMNFILATNFSSIPNKKIININGKSIEVVHSEIIEFLEVIAHD